MAATQPEEQATTEQSSRQADEETPLLSENSSVQADGGVLGNGAGEETIMPDEPSNKKLVVVLGSIYVRLPSVWKERTQPNWLRLVSSSALSTRPS